MLFAAPLAAFATYSVVAAKWLGVAVIVANIRSWPFAWMTRVFLPVVKLYTRYLVFRLSIVLHSPKEKKRKTREWLERLSPIGRDPLNTGTVYRTWAGLDDCDYNLHMSNSAYPKLLDVARMKAVLEHFPAYIRTGGFLVLGGTHFTFLREIPMLTKYEARISIGSWDDKWLYLIVKFVTYPKTKGNKKRKIQDSDPQTNSEFPPIPDVHTTISGTSTPNAALTALAQQKEPDGAVINCVSINEFVFKQGRVTVPPALALACEGYSGPAPDGSAYSADKPPPHSVKVREILDRGGMRAMRAFLRGGWQEVPKEERWWEDAFGGSVELKRAQNLTKIQGVRGGMDGAKELVSMG